jgi:DHA1 family tetracycline resistance protein-like MFS transporter
MATNRKAAMGFIFITLLIDVTGFGLIIPVMPKLIEELLHDSFHQQSISIWWIPHFGLCINAVFFAPVLGNLSDRYGRRPVLLFSLFGFGIDYLFFPSHRLLHGCLLVG